jgi:rod shape-determining protein MreC
VEEKSIKLLFSQGPSTATRTILLVLGSILLMTLDHRQQHMQSLRAGLSLLVAPIEYLVDLPVNLGRWVDESLSSRQSLIEENTRLHAQNLLMQARSLKNADLETENQRLRELLGSSVKVADRVLIAEIYKIDLDPFKHIVRLNKSARHGIYLDQPLLDAHGVMGQIIEIMPLNSTARLITDPGHSIPVQVSRNGLRTIALGSGKINQLDLPYLPNNADIEVGDLLVTSGLGGIYPHGYPVAKVTAIERAPALEFARIKAEPTAHINRSSEVLLVWSGDRIKMMQTQSPATPAESSSTGAPATKGPTQ